MSTAASRPGSALGRVHGVALYVGAVVGSGVLLVPAVAAELAGPASLLAWGFMIVMTLPLGLTMAGLSARFPGGGGVSTFAREAFGPWAGAVTGWLFLLAVPVAAPVGAFMAAGYAQEAFGLPPAARTAIAALILAVALISHYLGIRTAGWLQVAVVGSIVAVLAAAIVIAMPRVVTAGYTPFAPQGWLGVARAAAILFWCFVGWEAVSHLSGEFRNPARDLVPAVLWSAAVVGLLYLGTALAVVGTGSYGEGGRTETSLVLVMRTGLGPAAGSVTGLIALFCTIATTNAYVGAAAHLARALARERVAPAVMVWSHPGYGTPVAGLVFLALGFVVVLPLIGAGVTTVRALLAVPTANFIAVYMLGSAAGLRLAANARDRRLALAALVISLAVYPFLGWAALFPAVAVGAVRWLAGGRLQPAAAAEPQPAVCTGPCPAP